jgi:hypothetical protein
VELRSRFNEAQHYDIKTLAGDQKVKHGASDQGKFLTLQPLGSGESAEADVRVMARRQEADRAHAEIVPVPPGSWPGADAIAPAPTLHFQCAY